MTRKSQVRIFCKNTQSYHEFPLGTTLLEMYKALDIKLPYPLVSAKVNYKTQDLNFVIYRPKDVEFQDLSQPSGMRCYIRTLTMVFSCAVNDLFPNATLRVMHPISNGYYCTLTGLSEPFTGEVIERIKQRMSEIVSSDQPIYRQERRREEVKKLFAHSSDAKDELFDAQAEPYIRYFQMGDYVDYYNGELAPSSSYVSLFDLQPYKDGMLLLVPDAHNPNQLAEPFKEDKLFEVFKEFVEWNKLLKISNVGEFDTACRDNKSFNLIKLGEALHEKKISQIADMICHREQRPRFVLISGPSSSGKTTFSKRLTVQLMLNGLTPITISMDNYFVNRVDTPKDENGDYDFENVEALDLKLFKQHLQDLLAGKEIDLPTYSFEDGKRYFRGEKLKLVENSVLILEGIHALNPCVLPEGIDSTAIFKIYVSALTTINLDNHNWIPTADTRLLRRIVRDYRYRNYSARETIARRPSVSRGEEKWIFPYQENADVMFNSALLFELAVLKRHAEPILEEVPKYCEEYTEAHRLLKFLDYFTPIPEREIPPTSLLREFVGGSSFRY